MMSKEQELQQALQAAQDALTAYQSKPAVWVPEDRGMYFGVSSTGCYPRIGSNVGYTERHRKNANDESRIAMGNCYQTAALAVKAESFYRVQGLINQACLNVESDFVPRLKDTEQWKWSPGYNSADSRWMPIFSQMVYHGDPIQSTEAKCQQVCDILNDINLKPVGVK